MFNKKRKNNRGQALVEFAFILPIFFLILLFAIQVPIIIEKQEKTQMSVWMGLRSFSLVKWYAVIPLRRYSRSESEAMVKECFTTHDEVDVDFTDWLLGVNIKVSCKTPFLFKDLNWQPLWDVFGGIVKNGKIELESGGWILKSPFSSI